MFMNPNASIDYTHSFDLAVAKTKALPFGVYLFRTRTRISFGLMITIASIVLSVFAFLLGFV
jgi:hypothetical protein